MAMALRESKAFAKGTFAARRAKNCFLGMSTIIQLLRDSGDALCDPMEVPAGVSAEELQALVSQLTNADEDMAQRYSFFVDTEEIRVSLETTLRQLALSPEETVQISCRPLALFSVAAVSRCAADLPGHEDAVLCVQFSPDSRFLASASGDKTIRIWNASTTTCMHVLKGHTNWVLKLAYSPDGTRLASACYNAELRIWDPVGNRAMLAKPMKGHTKWVTAIAWEPLVSERDSRNAGPTRASERLVSASKDGSVRVWDTATGSPLRVLFKGTAAITDVKWTRSGFIAFSSEDCKVYVYAASDWKCVRVLQSHGHWVNSIALSSEWSTRFACYSHILGEEYRSMSQNLTEMLATCSDDHTMCLYNLQTIASDGKEVARMTGHVKPINHVCFSPNGLYLASASFDRTVRIWNGRTGKFIAKFRNHVSDVYQVCFSSDSKFLVSCSKDTTCKVYSMSRKEMIRDLPGHADEVYTVDWSLDGTMAASGSKDRLVKIWKN